MKNKSNSRRGAVSAAHSVLSASLFGACVGIFVAVLLLIICSALCLFSADPDRLLAPASAVIMLTVYFSAGFAASKKRPAAIPCGALSGALIALAFFVISLFIGSDAASGMSLTLSLLLRITLVAVSVLGALLGTNARSKRKKPAFSFKKKR